ncbi:RNA-binding domain-containing protein [Hyaloscypha variabilis F]|uniref:RNA-binding domain-containing protein n=1 Tax=Hyaloscypha variabilis (strain UAMH 11265 / GT02V1 / F) TaxID=1149755 RepID=A0A2J6QSS3_HYAVF|nr:RNA-binding domain-containing protein [Hyaloscypha variabilis F]
MTKRQRSSDDSGAADAIVSEDAQDHPTKKARKETNAGARRTLFVRSLPAIATSEALTKLFSESYPLKHATVVLDTETKQSKGYGFVTFADAEDAQKAADEYNGKIFLGRKMKIEVAQPRSREIVANAGMGGKRKSAISAEAAAIKKAREEKMAESKKPPKLIIRNLPWSVKTPEQLEELFRKFGKVKHSTLPKVKDKQAGFGFVVMRGRKNAEKALAAINGTTVDGRQLAVDWAVDKEVWEGQSKSASTEGADESGGEDGGAKLSDEAEPNEEDDVANFMKNFGDQLESEEEDDEEDKDQDENSDEEQEDEDDEDGFSDVEDDEDLSDEEPKEEKPQKVLITDNSTTIFVRNLPFTTLDPDLKEHFSQFGPVRYARVVMDRATERPKGTGFVCFFNVEDADNCFRLAPRFQPSGANATKKADTTKTKHSLLQDEAADSSGLYTIEGRVLQISKAVEKEKAVKLTEEGTNFRTDRDKDKRKLYLLSEGTVAAGTPLYDMLAPSEVKMREDSAMQRKKLIQNNPTLHLSLTRLSIRNLPRNVTSKDLKALAREAVVGFAKDVKAGLRAQLSKEEEARGGDEMREAEKQRKAKGKGIVRQAKIVFEGREGAKVSEDSGAGRSRGYGFVEYSSHRWALMGLRWLNGHAIENSSGKKQRLIVEFAIENAQVVSRRKEREEKARVRSKEVLEARARGELPEKSEKKPLSKNTVMAKTRKGMKGKKGRPEEGPKKSFEKVTVKTSGEKRKRGPEEETPKKKFVKGPNWNKKTVRNPKAKSEPEVDGKQTKRAQIIQKKRMARRERRQGA